MQYPKLKVCTELYAPDPDVRSDPRRWATGDEPTVKLRLTDEQQNTLKSAYEVRSRQYTDLSVFCFSMVRGVRGAV